MQAAHGEPAPPEAEPPVGGEATVITEPVEAGGTDDADAHEPHTRAERHRDAAEEEQLEDEAAGAVPRRAG